MKKIWPLVLFSLILGGTIPYLYATYPKEFLYLFIVFVITIIILLIKRGGVTIYDCLIIYMALIPFHTFRVGSERYFLRLTEVAFIPLFLWWVAQKVSLPQEERRIFHTEYLILALFLAFTIMSITQAINPIVSIYRTLILIYLVIFSFIVADILRAKDKIIIIIKAMMVIASLAGIVSVLQSFIPRLNDVSTNPMV